MADRIGIIIDLAGATETKTSLKEILDAVNQLNGKHVNLNFGSTGQIDQTTRSVSALAESLNAVGDVFNTLGGMSGAVANFSSSIGRSFNQMNQVFKTDIGSTVLKTLTYNATNGVLGNMDKTISRYDILNTFTQYMGLAGVGRQTANAALNRVNESILGLPIGLDEAAQRLRRYQMFLGDTNAATDLTIGVQNAIMAGGATSAARTQTYNLIERLIATGGLTNVRQWQALLVGLGVSQRYIAQELGVDPKNLLQDLSSKAISTDQFLAALQRLGTGATDAAVQLNSALGIYKNTLEAWLSNIQFAFTRGNANILSALNESLERGTGQGITGYMSDTRNAINEMYKGGASFITQNPELLSDFVSGARELINVLGRFSASRFATQAIGNLGRLMDLIGGALDRIPEGKLESFAAFATTLAGPIGKLFSAVGSGAPVMVGVFERFENYDWEGQIDAIIDAGSEMAELVNGVLSLINDSTMQQLIAYGLVWGKPVQGFFNALGNGLKALASGYITLKAAGVVGGASGLGMAELGTILGSVGLGVGAAGGAIALNGIAASAETRQREGLFKGMSYDQLRAARQRIEADMEEINRNDTTVGSSYGVGMNTLLRYREYVDELIESMRRPSGLNGTLDAAEGKFKSIGESVQKVGQSIIEAAGESDYAGESYMALADMVEESVDIQISAFTKLKTEAAHTFSELFDIWSGNTDINNRWSEALGVLMNYGLQNPDSMAVIQELVNQGPEAGLATAESWVEEILAGRGLDQTTAKFNAYAEAAEKAARAQALLQIAFSEESAFDFADSMELISNALNLDPIYFENQLRQFFGESDTITREQLAEFVQSLSSGLGEAKDAAKKGYNGVTSEITSGGKRAANAAKKANAAIERAMSQLNVSSDEATAAIAEWGWAVQQGIISAKILAVAAANDAVNAINAALGNVRATPGSASVDRRSGRTSGRTQTLSANGGLIYAANGQLIDFIPVGTDTVPAMLTPGEFVIRRAAVNRVGIPFLDSINRMDMAGAFDRAIKTGIFSGGGMVRNYYRDNHAQVTMNNYRASQDYSSRRMGRYVRSL